MTEAIVVAIDDVRIAANALLHERDRLREKLSVADRSISENSDRITELRSLLSNARNRNDALETERDQLRAALATATQRADAAEAKLTAVPVDALRRHMRYSEVADHHHRYDPVQQGADEKAIDAWLAQQSEVQP
jgi:chromosome segregation ATPase